MLTVMTNSFWRSSVSITPTTVLTIVMGYFVFKATWRNTPDWIKPKRFRSEQDDGNEEGGGKGANDDLADLTIIVQKMMEMGRLVDKECGRVTPDEMPWYKLHACFLKLLHNAQEIRLKHPEYRREMYQSSGSEYPPPSEGEAAAAAGTPSLAKLDEYLNFAEWAYLSGTNELRRKLKALDYELIRQDLATEPGRVGHYLAFNSSTKTLLVSLKGTSTLSDVLTDVIGKAVKHQLETSPFDDDHNTEIACHEGIWTAARTMADDIQRLIEHLFLPSEYKILICGHSLGAGTACLLGILLRSRLSELRESTDRLSVMAFATPPVLNYAACTACQPYTVSVVNNSDVVPRMSLSNLVIMNKLLIEVDRQLRDHGLSPDSYQQMKKFASDLITFDEDITITPDELEDFFNKAHAEEDPHSDENLFVPGKVVLFYDKQMSDGEDDKDEDDDDEGAECQYGCVVGDGVMKMLRQIELMTTMVEDHSCVKYRAAIQGLLSSKAAAAQGTS